MTTPLPPAGRVPVAPKAYGAAFGAGTGNALALITISLLESLVTHHPLDSGVQAAVYGLATVLTALAGAYLAPHQDRPPPA